MAALYDPLPSRKRKLEVKEPFENVVAHNSRFLTIEKLQEKLLQEEKACQLTIRQGKVRGWVEIKEIKYPYPVFIDKFENGAVAYSPGAKPMKEEYLFTTLKINGIAIPLYGVFDGHGTNGKYCAKYLKDHLAKELEPLLKADLGKPDFEYKLCNILMTIFVHLGRKFRREYPKCQSGSCANIVLIVNNILYDANLGDSRAFISTGKDPIALSREAKPDDTDFEQDYLRRGGTLEVKDGAKRVSKQGAGMLNITRACCHDEERTAVCPRAKVRKYDLTDLKPDAHLIILTDGVRGQIQEISDRTQQWIQEDKTCTDIAELQLQTSHTLGTQANATALIFNLSKELLRINKKI